MYDDWHWSVRLLISVAIYGGGLLGARLLVPKRMARNEYLFWFLLLCSLGMILNDPEDVPWTLFWGSVAIAAWSIACGIFTLYERCSPWATFDIDENGDGAMYRRFLTEKGAKRFIAGVVKDIKASGNPFAYIQIVKVELCTDIRRVGWSSPFKSPTKEPA